MDNLACLKKTLEVCHGILEGGLRQTLVGTGLKMKLPNLIIHYLVTLIFVSTLFTLGLVFLLPEIILFFINFLKKFYIHVS